MIEPIHRKPALQMGRVLILADLHLGIEAEFKEKGVYIPFQGEKMLREIEEMIEGIKAEKIIILGDVKHTVYPRLPYKIGPLFLELLEMGVGVEVVVGNHDGGLEKLLPPGVVFHPSSGFVLKDVGMFHGHAWPSKSLMETDILVCAHNHPTVALKDAHGSRIIERCWIRTSLRRKRIMERYKISNICREMLIIPAFNPLLGGAPFNENQNLLGPLFTNRCVNIKESQIFLLDGAYLGKVKNLQ